MTTTAMNTSRGPGSQVGAGPLVDAEWLEAHLQDPRVRVVEVDVSSASYADWHIHGAVLWNIYEDLKDGDYRTVGSDRLEQLLIRSGIHPDSIVVFYGYAPAMGFWLLKLYRHSEVRILDCSRPTWRAEGRPWSVAPSNPEAGAYRMGQLDLSVRAEQASVAAAMAQPGFTVMDVRSEAEFRGECFWPSGAMQPGGTPGHIPGAVHQPIDGLYDHRGAFRSAPDLRRVFSPATLDRGDDLITYCTIGGRAATAWFVLVHLLGRDHVRVYDGSWAEWGRTAEAPVETI